MKDPTIFEKVEWEGQGYRDERGARVRFSKQVCVLVDGEQLDTKLCFTTRDGVPAPCLRVDGERINFDDAGFDIEVASDCIFAAKAV
ncbi:MAG: hypothetical protein RLZZ450_70 [Pseudomonadota bacterium]|jgi:ribosomal protein L14